jgi:hypothetical protein
VPIAIKILFLLLRNRKSLSQGVIPTPPGVVLHVAMKEKRARTVVLSVVIEMIVILTGQGDKCFQLFALSVKRRRKSLSSPVKISWFIAATATTK